MVDEDAGQLVADGPLDKCGRHRRIDTARQPAQDLPVPHQFPDRADLCGDEVRTRPVRRTASDLEQEVGQQLLALLGVQNLRMPLHAGQPPHRIRERRHRRAGTAGEGYETRGCGRDRVPVAHPHVQHAGQPVGQPVALHHLHGGSSELGGGGALHRATQTLRHSLEAVADAEHRHPTGEQVRGDLGGSRLIDRLWTAGQDDRLGVARQHVCDGRGVRHDLGVDVCLPDATGDELGVLRTEVDDDDWTRCHARKHRTATTPGGME